jgi:hypothetical protein
VEALSSLRDWRPGEMENPALKRWAIFKDGEGSAGSLNCKIQR